MKEQKRKYTAAVIIFIILFLFMAAISLIKFMFLSEGAFDKNAVLAYICAAAVLALLIFVYAIYCFLTRSHLLKSPKLLALIVTCMGISYAACVFCESIDIYLMPVFLTAFLLAPLLKRKDTFAANLFLVLCVLTTLVLEYSFSGRPNVVSALIMTVIGIFSGSLVAFTLSYERKRLDFLIKGIAICIGSIVLVTVLSYPVMQFDPTASASRFIQLLNSVKWAAIAIFAQLLLTLILQPVFEKAFNLLTNSRLVELTDHGSPLIKRLIAEAPGTFNHSLAVANFAEVCATAIGENPYMARAAAYYHDIGKLSSPSYFMENQHGTNPHDNILPEVSVEIIRGHTKEGYKLCKQYHIPDEIARVSIEHHGTMPISIFYQKAKGLTDSDISIKDYSYEGYAPTTKIAAIIMICDAAEAALRAMDSPDALRVEELLSSLIWSRIQSGQFDECDITLKQLSTVQNTIAGSFGGVYHKRLKYPENKL